jgi:hypothetical protein
MDTFGQSPIKKQGINKILLAAFGIGAILVLAIVAIIALNPSTKEVQQQALDGAFREGSPEFETYTKRIVAQTIEDRTNQSMTGLGTITMFIGGSVRNMTGKTLVGLEMKVSVVDMLGKVVRDKTFTVVPNLSQGVAELENNQTLPIQVNVEGFAKEDDRANIHWKVTAIKVK